MALGTLVLGAAVQLYSQGVNATWVVSQRAEMQQDFRAASNMLTRDLSLAGAGLGDNVQLALITAAKTPVIGCDQTGKCWINNAALPYPKQGTTPYMYGLIPEWQKGPSMNSTLTDAVTVVFTDSNFYMNCYSASVTSATVVKFQLNSAAIPTGCLPTGVTTPQALNDASLGLTAGDVIIFTLTSGSGSGATTSQIVAEVTAAPVVTTPTPPNTSAYNITFALNDALLMNQGSATAGALSKVLNWTGTGTRALVTSYFIDNTTTPPRLMRQVSGHTAMPVAENVVFLQFDYDLYANGTVYTNQPDGGASVTPTALTPNQITKINVRHMAMDSTLNGGLFGGNKGFQGMDLQTSVSARDLTYQNGYPIGP